MITFYQKVMKIPFTSISILFQKSEDLSSNPGSALTYCVPLNKSSLGPSPLLYNEALGEFNLKFSTSSILFIYFDSPNQNTHPRNVLKAAGNKKIVIL